MQLAKRNDYWPSVFGDGFWRNFDSLFDFGDVGGFAENEKEYVWSVNVAGLKKDEIKIETSNGYLSVHGDNGKQKYTYVINLPSYVNLDGATATVTDGLLSVTLPKTEGAKTKTIAITDGSESAKQITE